MASAPMGRTWRCGHGVIRWWRLRNLLQIAFENRGKLIGKTIGKWGNYRKTPWKWRFTLWESNMAMGNPLWMEVSLGQSLINGSFSSKPRLLPEGRWVMASLPFDDCRKLFNSDENDGSYSYGFGCNSSRYVRRIQYVRLFVVLWCYDAMFVIDTVQSSCFLDLTVRGRSSCLNHIQYHLRLQ